MSTLKKCDKCSLCCKILPIQEIKKPENILCINCNEGCSIYNNRPSSCKDFKCEWLIDNSMSTDLKPNNCDIIFEKISDKILIGNTDIKNIDAWKKDNVKKYIKSLNDEGVSVVISSFSNSPKIFFLAKGDTKESVFYEIIKIYNKK